MLSKLSRSISSTRGWNYQHDEHDAGSVDGFVVGLRGPRRERARRGKGDVYYIKLIKAPILHRSSDWEVLIPSITGFSLLAHLSLPLDASTR